MTRLLAAAVVVLGLVVALLAGRAGAPAGVPETAPALAPRPSATVEHAPRARVALPPPRWSPPPMLEVAPVAPPSKARATLARRVRWTTEVLELGPGEAIALERIAATLEDARESVDRRRETRALDPAAAEAAIEALELRAEQELAALVGPERHARLLDLWDRAPPGDG